MRHEQTPLDNHIIFAIQLLSYASIPIMLAYGTLVQWLIAIVCMYLFFHVGIAVTFHRLLTHRAFETGPITKVILTLLGTLATNGSSLYWVALHTTHHKYSDSEKDVHSPRFGFWKTWFMPMYPQNPVDSTKNALRLAKEPLQLFFHKYYWFVIATYVAILWAIDPFAVVYAFLVPVCYSWAMTAIVNAICHEDGYRNFETKDNSTNNKQYAWITGGESFHNNHHARPSNANFGSNESEFDPGYWFIRMLAKFNLATLK
jgi:fatty-acid desaturase